MEEIEPGRLLRLRAEMRLPGLAWLELRVDTDGAGRTRYRQRALFHPRGLLGHAYWWSVSPFHALVFGGMARNIALAAAEGADGPGSRRTRSATRRRTPLMSGPAPEAPRVHVGAAVRAVTGTGEGHPAPSRVPGGERERAGDGRRKGAVHA